MKAFLLSAALAVMPVVAGAATVDVYNESLDAEFYSGTGAVRSTGGTTVYAFHIDDDLENVVLELSATGGNGVLTYSINGGAATAISTPYASLISVGGLTAGDFIVTYTYTPPLVGRIVSVGTTATLYGDVVAADVPLPAAGLMALAGVASLGAARSRRRKS